MRPPVTLARAPALTDNLVIIGGQKGGPVDDELEQRALVGQAIGAVVELAARARLGPLPRRSAQPRAHRIALDIARGGKQMRLVLPCQR